MSVYGDIPGANHNTERHLARAMENHTLSSIKFEITRTEATIKEWEERLDGAKRYLDALNERHAKLIIEDADADGTQMLERDQGESRAVVARRVPHGGGLRAGLAGRGHSPVGLRERPPPT